MSFLANPMALITDFFPVAPYSFDTPPENNATQPLSDIFTVLAKRFAQYQSDILLLKSQVTVQEASGPYLDLHGAEYGIPRIQSPYETDEPYRARILAGTRKLTIPAILLAVQMYYKSKLPANQQPTIDVYDLQSNPTKAAIAQLVTFEFVIDVSFQILSSTAFFLDRSYFDTQDYLMDADGMINMPSDPELSALVNSIRAANTVPVYIQRIHFVTAYA